MHDPARPTIVTISGRPVRLVEDWRAHTASAAELQLASGEWRPVSVEPLDAAGPLTPRQARTLLATARALHRCCRDGVLHVLDAGTAGGWPALVTDRWTGAPLRALMWGVPLPARAAFELAAQVASVLADAHAARPAVAHGRLSSDAVLLTDQGRVCVRGFGRSGPAGAAGGPLPADDVYALGALLYEALAGEPLPGLPLDAEAHGARVFDLIVALPILPGALVFLLAGCLAFDPADRPAASDLAASLAEVAAEEEGEGLAEWLPRALRLLRGEEDATAEVAPVIETEEREETERNEIIEPPVGTGPADTDVDEDISDDHTERALDPVTPPPLIEALPAPHLEAPAAVLVEARAPAELSADDDEGAADSFGTDGASREDEPTVQLAPLPTGRRGAAPASRRPIVVLAAIGLLCGALGGWWVVHRHDNAAAPAPAVVTTPPRAKAPAAPSAAVDPPAPKEEPAPPPAEPPPKRTLPELPEGMFEVLPPADERHQAVSIVEPDGPPTRVVVRAVMATEVILTCGDQEAVGGTAASIKDLETTACTVEVHYEDDIRTADIDVVSHMPVTCVPDGDDELFCE